MGCEHDEAAVQKIALGATQRGWSVFSFDAILRRAADAELGAEARAALCRSAPHLFNHFAMLLDRTPDQVLHHAAALGPIARPLVPQLVADAIARRGRLQRETLEGLCAIDPGHPLLVQALRQMLGSADAEERWFALGRLDSGAEASTETARAMAEIVAKGTPREKDRAIGWFCGAPAARRPAGLEDAIVDLLDAKLMVGAMLRRAAALALESDAIAGHAFAALPQPRFRAPAFDYLATLPSHAPALAAWILAHSGDRHMSALEAWLARHPELAPPLFPALRRFFAEGGPRAPRMLATIRVVEAWGPAALAVAPDMERCLERLGGQQRKAMEAALRVVREG